VLTFLAEFWAFMRARKKFWLLPVIVMALALGGLVFLTTTAPTAPFIYTIF